MSTTDGIMCQACPIAGDRSSCSGGRPSHQWSAMAASQTTIKTDNRRHALRIATFIHDGQRHVGEVSDNGQQVTPFDLASGQAQRGAQPLIEAMVAGQALPARAAKALTLNSVRLEAPLPLPRRNLWCVGAQLPRAREGTAGVRIQEQQRRSTGLADRLHESARVRDRAKRRCAVAACKHLRADRLRGRADRHHRHRRQEHCTFGCNAPRVRLHARQRRDRTRRADAASAMGPGQVVRYILPDGAVDRDGGRARHHAVTRALLGQRRATPGRTCSEHDLRHSDLDRNHLARHHAVPG